MNTRKIPFLSALLLLGLSGFVPVHDIVRAEEEEPATPVSPPTPQAVEPPRAPPPSPKPTPDITAAEILHSIAWLADDARGGRMSGTPGCVATEDWLVENLKALRLRSAPGAKDYRQVFPLPGGEPRPAECTLKVKGRGGDAVDGALGREFHILEATDDVEIDAAAVFVGFGIRASEHQFDEYEGLDVKGKVVLALRHEPRESDAASRWNGKRMTRHSAFVSKARVAEAAGAAALIIVNDPLNHEGDSTAGLNLGATDGTVRIPVIFATREVAAALLAGGPSLDELQSTIDTTDRPASRALDGSRVRLRLGIERTNTANVAAYLPGTDPSLKDEWVIIGAHYDHVGDGRNGGLDEAGQGQIHNGADDNGSGTAAALELAAHFAHSKDNRRSLLFLWFAGEEIGLLGSAWYRAQPLVPHASVAAMINLDMVGRYRPGSLEAVGASSGSGIREIVDAALTDLDLKIRHTNRGMVSSDGFHFHEAGIPTLFLFTGLHSNYHRPTDDWWTVDAEGTARVTTLASRIIRALARADKRPEYKAIPRQEMFPVQPVVLGVTFEPKQDGEGATLSMVLENSPAGRAGLRKGDRIERFGDTEITGPPSLRGALDAMSPGSKAKLQFTRDGEVQTVDVQF
jgi:hypothetical protein